MKIYATADQLVLIHSGQERTLERYGIPTASAVTITHSIDVERFFEGAVNPSVLQLPKRSNRVTVLYLGTIGVSHDLQGLLAAIADSRIANMPIDFAVVGDGECLAECRSIAENTGMKNAKFYPPVTLEEVPNVLTQADLLIASFRNDLNTVISSKIYEYCAAGRPIIVFGECAAARLVAKIGNGWVCSDRTSESLFDALTEYLSNPEGSNERGRLGTRYARTHFDASSSSEKWNSVLLDLVKES